MPDGFPGTFDFVIVGAGSAGRVLAHRLTEDGRTTVLLLEYGGSDRSLLVQMPSALSTPMNQPRYNWGYETEPEPYLAATIHRDATRPTQGRRLPGGER